jgi:bifunctional enzyme Fae/Hps
LIINFCYNVNMKLNSKIKHLQVAFNGNLDTVLNAINLLPVNEHIIIEAGTPFIKKYGKNGIRNMVDAWQSGNGNSEAYVVADLKCMDRGFTEVQAAASAGASAATCLGLAPIETINDFIKTCRECKIDSMIDMLNEEFPFEVLQKLSSKADIVVLHQGVDEKLNKEKRLPLFNIGQIKGAYNTLISIAGCETVKEANSVFFNGADIAVVWKNFYEEPYNTNKLAEEFLLTIKGYAKKRKK